MSDNDLLQLLLDEIRKNLKPACAAIVNDLEVQETGIVHAAMKRLLAYRPEQPSARARLMALISEIRNALMPASLYLRKLTGPGASFSSTAIQCVLDLVTECVNELEPVTT